MEFYSLNAKGSGPLSISLEYSGHVVTMALLTTLLCFLCFYYSRSIRGCTSYEKMPRITFLMYVAIQWIRKNTYQIIGKSYSKVVPFFVYIIAFFWFSNIIAILGFDSVGNSLVVPTSLALVVFLGTVISGIVYRGHRFFGDYVIWIRIAGKKIFPLLDPLKLIGELSRVLSLSFRLWGNTLAGSLILFVVYAFTHDMFTHNGVDYLGPIIFPLFLLPLHIYFDIIGGTIQPMIFMLLTMCYWGLARHGEGASERNYDVQPEEFVV